MIAYSIFDDFTPEAMGILEASGVKVTIHPLGVPRPDDAQMKSILENYDCVIIGTSQKITEDMFSDVNSPRIIATASVGLDHIHIPEDKKELVRIINTPTANARSVAEFTFSCALCCVKRLREGSELYRQGKNNKSLSKKPEDLFGKTIGVIGAGNISVQIMEYARFFGMQVLCYTRNRSLHSELPSKGVRFVSLEDLAVNSDVISVNIPSNAGTKGLISDAFIRKTKEDCVFISISRLDTVDADCLIKKAQACPNFYVCLDADVDQELVSRLPNLPNIIITPHIAGGTVETRKRMFRELALGITKLH